MKRLTILLITLSVIFSLLYFKNNSNYIDRWINFSFCDDPITFRIGDIDSKFKLSKEQAIEVSKKSARIWNDILKKDLFIYDDTSELTINFIYDKRQESYSEISKEKQVVEKDKNLLEISSANFEQKRQEVENRLADLNKKIDYYNNLGGAPKDIYDQLISEQNTVQKEINDINEMANRLNKTTQDINSKIEEVNEYVGKFNDVLKELPEEGLYKGGENVIEIYIVENPDKLAITIAHELGHALGLEHIETPDAMMNPTSTDNTSVTQEDVELIKSFCTNQNRIDLIKNDLSNIFYFIKTNYLNQI